MSRGCVELSRAEAEKSLSESRAKADATSEPIYKEIKNKDVKRKAKKTTTSRPKISLDDPCASCPANKEKSTRFVDNIRNQRVVVEYWVNTK